MRNVELLAVRKQTENEAVRFEGITDMEFVQYMNDAQYNVQSAIVQTHPRVFLKKEFNCCRDKKVWHSTWCLSCAQST